MSRQGKDSYLCNPVSLFDLKCDVGMVEENDTKGTAIIFVHNTGTDVNEVFSGETGSGSHAAVGAVRHGNFEIRGNDGLPASLDQNVGSRVEVVSGSQWRSLGRSLSLVADLDELQEGGSSRVGRRHLGLGGEIGAVLLGYGGRRHFEKFEDKIKKS